MAEVGGAGEGLHKGEALLSAPWEPSLEEYRVSPPLGVQERCVTKHGGEEVNTLVPLCEVGGVNPHPLRAARTGECPTRGDLQEGQATAATTILYATALSVNSHKGLEA